MKETECAISIQPNSKCFVIDDHCVWFPSIPHFTRFSPLPHFNWRWNYIFLALVYVLHFSSWHTSDWLRSIDRLLKHYLAEITFNLSSTNRAHLIKRKLLFIIFATIPLCRQKAAGGFLSTINQIKKNFLNSLTQHIAYALRCVLLFLTHTHTQYTLLFIQAYFVYYLNYNNKWNRSRKNCDRFCMDCCFSVSTVLLIPFRFWRWLFL